jgi:two-component system response regulator YesN
MRTLLIADDESKIRLGLRAMIDREFPGVYEIAFAADGEEALSIVNRQSVDILITDIRMPEMDGITLIQRLGSISHKPAVLILSGYDDFQYAKEAIRYEVKEYLLKPIVREELFGALLRIEGELIRDEHIYDRLQESDHYREALRASTLNSIFARTELDDAEIVRRCVEVGLQQFEPSYYVGLVYGDGGQRERFKGESLLQHLARERNWSWVGLEDKDGQWVVVTDRPELFQVMLEHSSASGVEGVKIGLSSEGKSIGAIKACYNEAKHALKYRLMYDQSHPGLIRYEGVKHRELDYPIPIDSIRKLANMLGTDREKEMKGLLLELFDPRKLIHVDIGYVEGIVKSLNELVFDQVFNTYGEASIEIFKMYKKAGNIYNFTSIHDYYHAVENLLLSLNDYIKHIKAIHVEHKEMSKAIQFIQEQYDKDLSMAMVSNHVSLNYSYFSQCFKEFTGESFVNYLKKVRVHRAKEFLETTDDKVYEISRKVGFENPKQFNRVFRELEGISAMEYRQNKISLTRGRTT